ncbi:MAG: hypothetical protein J5522_09055 [Lachnospiraceae bacterium]|nr:hypothetical protein [Lachnospiraceae bacterium]
MSMYNIKRLFALLLIIVFSFTTVFNIMPEKAVRADDDLIAGIDYTRFGQEIGFGSYDVELKLGDLKFAGKLENPGALSIADMNKIIEQEMDVAGLTPVRLQVLTTLVTNLDMDVMLATYENWMKSMMALLPSKSGIGVDDVYDYLMYGYQKDYDKLQVDAVNEKADAILNKAAEIGVAAVIGIKYDSKQKVKVPGFGMITNGIKSVKKYYKGDNKRFSKYLDDLSNAIGDVAAFYAACTRRMDELAMDREKKKVRIIFDKEIATVDHNGTFWGIPNVSTQWELSGELVRSSAWDFLKDGTGNYSGNLELTISGIDMRLCFDPDWSYKTTLLPEWIGQYAGLGLYKGMLGALGISLNDYFKSYTDKANVQTNLKISQVGNFTVTVSNLSVGDNDLDAKGYFGNKGSITDFSFDHTARHEFNQMVVVDKKEPLSYEEVYMRSNDIHSIYFSAKAEYWKPAKWDGIGDKVYERTDGNLSYMEDEQLIPIPRSQLGDIFDPLEKKTIINVKVPNTFRVGVTVNYWFK